MVVRSVANSDENGFSIDPAKPDTVEYSFDVSQISADLKTYLDNYEQHNDRFGQITFIEKKYEIDPADLSVVAFVQDVKTKHVLQAAYAKLGGIVSARWRTVDAPLLDHFDSFPFLPGPHWGAENPVSWSIANSPKKPVRAGARRSYYTYKPRFNLAGTCTRSIKIRAAR